MNIQYHTLEKQFSRYLRTFVSDYHKYCLFVFYEEITQVVIPKYDYCLSSTEKGFIENNKKPKIKYKKRVNMCLNSHM